MERVKNNLKLDKKTAYFRYIGTKTDSQTPDWYCLFSLLIVIFFSLNLLLAVCKNEQCVKSSGRSEECQLRVFTLLTTAHGVQYNGNGFSLKTRFNELAMLNKRFHDSHPPPFSFLSEPNTSNKSKQFNVMRITISSSEVIFSDKHCNFEHGLIVHRSQSYLSSSSRLNKLTRKCKMFF